MLNLLIFGLEFENTTAIFEISVFEFVLLQSFLQKQKSLDFGQTMSDLGIFGLEFENNIVLFEIRTLNFVLLQNFSKK